MVLQCRHIGRLALRGQVGRAGHGHPAQWLQRTRHHPLIGDGAGAQGGIETFLHQIHQTVTEHGLHLQLRMPFQQRPQQRHQHLAPEH
ncbi:hypothetical protein D3C71_719760 [compost metagenome]